MIGFAANLAPGLPAVVTRVGCILIRTQDPAPRWGAAISQDPPYNPAGDEEPQLLPRLLGLDVGSKTIGLAVSDPLGITAQGLETLRRKNKRTDFERLGQLVGEYQIAEFVVGYPRRLSGASSAPTGTVEQVAAELRARFGLPVHLYDERLTSVEAGRLLRASEMSIQRRGEVVDRLAAVLILQGFLDRRRAGV